MDLFMSIYLTFMGTKPLGFLTKFCNFFNLPRVFFFSYIVYEFQLCIRKFSCFSNSWGFVLASQELVASLHRGWNTPTILQSLGCIAQHSVSSFEAQYGEIRSYIIEKIFQVIEASCTTLSLCIFSCPSIEG